MNKKLKMALFKNNTFAWHMLRKKEFNERMIANWIKKEKETNDSYWHGMKCAYIDANRDIKDALRSAM